MMKRKKSGESSESRLHEENRDPLSENPMQKRYPERGFSEVPEFSTECREEILLPGHDAGEKDGLIHVSESP